MKPISNRTVWVMVLLRWLRIARGCPHTWIALNECMSVRRITLLLLSGRWATKPETELNFERTYDWLKSVEKSRPVQYERAQENYNTDIYCRMYRSVDEIKAYVDKKDIYRPFILL